MCLKNERILLSCFLDFVLQDRLEMNNHLEAAVPSFRGWNIPPNERMSSCCYPGTSKVRYL